MTALHWSQLRHMARSPAHYKYALEHGIPITAAMRLGSLAHAMVLGVTRSFVVYPKDRRGNAWKEFQAEHAGVEIVTAKEWSVASDIAHAVGSNEQAAPLLSGIKEHGIEWEVAGRPCAGTLDVNGVILCDLKTTADAEPAHFQYHATRMGWQAQLAWYRDGLILSGLPEPSQVSIIAVEQRPPHVVTVFDLNDEALDFGSRTYRGLLERLAVCEQNNCWPGYVQGISVLGAPDEQMLVIDGEEVEL